MKNRIGALARVVVALAGLLALAPLATHVIRVPFQFG